MKFMKIENVIMEIEDALSGNLAKAGNVYNLSLNGLKDKALTDALSLLEEQKIRELTMLDKENIVKGLGAIRRFFEIGQPSQAIIFDSYQNIIDGAIELIHDQQSQIEIMKEQECAKIKEPDCRICGQSHCKYYHESRKPTECKSYIRMESR